MTQPKQGTVITFDDFPKTFEVVERATNKSVLATCIGLTREIAVERIDKKWWKGLLYAREAIRQEPDFHWKWAHLLGSLRSSRGGGYVRGWGVEIEGEEEIQGAIQNRTDALSVSRNSDGTRVPAVYCERLATAPRNRGRLTASKSGRFKGVGTGLLKLAVAHSHYLNGQGRVSLTSVDHPDTIKLYENFGFVSAATLPEDRMVLELTKEAATRYLKEMGL